MSHPVFLPTGVASHHSLVSRVECGTLASELKQHLLSVRSKDPKVIQLRKDVQQGKNKAAETIAALLTDAHNRNQPIGHGIASTISGFFTARTRSVRRKWRELRSAETKVEGRMNCTELEIDQGDHSRGRLLEMKENIQEYRKILDEEEAAIDQALFASAQL